MLLTRNVGEGEIAWIPAEIDAVELRGKTALHIATAYDRADIVQLLLAHKAAVNAASDGGWTLLHNACDKGCEEIVWILVSEGAHINAQLLNGIMPLHLAAQGGHKEVVECLLKRPELKRRVRDNFGSTPFLCAAQFKRKDVVLLLAPFNNVESLSDDVKDACAAFDATVVNFGNFYNENRVKRMSVFNLLYGRDRENPRKQAVTTVPADSRGADFRWIHLPANNMAWVEALLTKSFIEEGAHDVDGFKGLEKSFNYQHRGQRTHSHFMRPLCQNTPWTLLRRHEDESSEEPASENMQAKVIDTAARKQKGTGGKPDKVDSYFHDEGLHGKKSKNNQKRGKSGSAPGTPKQETKGKSPWGQNEKQARSSPLSSSNLCKDPHPLVSACNVCVFMPYLHFETTERRQKMQDAISRAETLDFVSNGMKRMRTRDEMLIDAHLSSSTTSLHVRRTLDQFFYPNIDTKSRDQDQVVYRYQTKSPGMEADPKIFMVDQLWMWVLGTNLIVTAFPQRWDQPKNDPLNVLDGIIEDINSKTRDPINSPPKPCDGTDESSSYCDEDGQLLFVDRLLDIGQETNLLAEIKDIRDELNMIRTVLEHQNNVLLDFHEVVCETYQG
ncbi:hypothetical protein DTO006G1_7939 [Penicillium roqueforti]|nr:hypothetical protein DTO006G1_7939 [Penicillium roqueforti]